MRPWRQARRRHVALPGLVVLLAGGVCPAVPAPSPLAARLVTPLAAQEPPSSEPSSSVDPDSLAARGRLQEAVWAARAAGDTVRAERLLGRLDSILRSEPLSAAPLSVDSQGVSYTFRLEYDGGVAAIFKVDGSDIFCPECGADREVAAYRLDRLLGVDLTPVTVPLTIERDGTTLTGSAMAFVHDARLPRPGLDPKPDLLRFFDAVIGNSDRHRANWLILPDGRPVAIDHNRAFEYRPGTRPKSCWETEIDSIADPAALGAPLDRYRTLPDESLAEAVAGVVAEPRVRAILAIRPRILERLYERIERRGAGGGIALLRDCDFAD